MPTNEERREVARRLRELPTDMYEVEELWEMKGLDTCCKDQTDYYLIHFALFKCFPVDHMHPCDYEELHMRLADLIEPEPERTCHVEKYHPESELYFETCSECGCILSANWPGDRHCMTAKYCPNCGAKVVDE